MVVHSARAPVGLALGLELGEASASVADAVDTALVGLVVDAGALAAPGDGLDEVLLHAAASASAASPARAGRALIRRLERVVIGKLLDLFPCHPAQARLKIG
jgi:hypothetical protein